MTAKAVFTATVIRLQFDRATTCLLLAAAQRPISLRFNGHFPGEPELAGFIGAKDDGGGGDSWSYKQCPICKKNTGGVAYRREGRGAAGTNM